MARTASWDESAPAGTVAANTLDTIIQNLKRDIRERLDDVVGDFSDDAVDPLRIKVHTGTDFPSTPNVGEMFYKTNTDAFYIYNGSWVLLSGGSSAVVQTGLLSNRPAANTVDSGALFWALDNDTLYLQDSNEWFVVGGGGEGVQTYRFHQYLDANGPGNKVTTGSPPTRLFVIDFIGTTTAGGEVTIDLDEFDNIKAADIISSGILTMPHITQNWATGQLTTIIYQSLVNEVFTFVCLDNTGAVINAGLVQFALWIPAVTES